eukprot:jgi/Mesvir1/5304/Mv15402-RA.1
MAATLTATAALEQIVAQAGSAIEFHQLTSTGPDHARRFLCELKVDDVVITNAERSSLKAAKQECCSIALCSLRKWAAYGYREPGGADGQGGAVSAPDPDDDDANMDISMWSLVFEYIDKPPSKDKVFFTRLCLNKRSVAYGTGRTKKDAQFEAAGNALITLKALSSAVQDQQQPSVFAGATETLAGDFEKTLAVDAMSMSTTTTGVMTGASLQGGHNNADRNHRHHHHDVLAKRDGLAHATEPQPWTAALEAFARARGEKVEFHEERDGVGFQVAVALKGAGGESRLLGEVVVRGISLVICKEEAAKQSFKILLNE